MKKLFVMCFTLILSTLVYSQWVQTNGPNGGFILSVTANETDIFAGTVSGIFHSSNNGGTWTKIHTVQEGVRALAVLTKVSGEMYLFSASAWGGELIRLTENSIGWKVDSLPTPKSVFCFRVSGENIFAGTFEGIYLSTDYGTNWAELNTGLTDEFVRALAIDGSNIYAGTDNGLVFLSVNNGLNWTNVSSFGGNSYPRIREIAVLENRVFVATPQGVYVSSDNGASWVEFNSGLPQTINYCFAVSGSNIFAGTEGGGVFLSNIYSTTWTAVNNYLASPNVYSLFISGTNLFAGTDKGIFLSSNNGTNWNEVNSGLISTDVYTIAVSGSNLFAGTWRNGVYLSSDNGTLWNAVNNGLTNTNIRSLALSGVNLFVGTDGAGVFLSTNNGANWNEVNSGLMHTYVLSLATSGTNIFAGTWRGGVFLSTNNGSNWTPINEGLANSPFDSTGYADINCFIINDTNLFVGTYGAGIFLSTNNGTSWTAVNSGLSMADWTPTHYVSINCLASYGNNLFAGTEKGIFLSSNNGTNWNQVYAELQMSVNSFAIDGMNIFAGTPDDVLLSMDNGVSWTNVGTGLPPRLFLRSKAKCLAVSGTNLLVGTKGNGVWRRPLSELVPVELTSFTASANGKEITLNWTTATELNNQGFEVQRKFSSSEFVTVGSVKGKGTTTSPNHYSFVDKLINGGKYFYRLKQVDFSGTFEYSNAIEVEVKTLDKFTLEQNYPNPFNPTTKISWQSPVNSRQTLKVFDILGNEVATLVDEEMEAGYHSVDFSASELPSGVYFYRLHVGNFIENKKMLLLH
jgi:ligand-binding sensor domain-containing protein